MGWYGEAGKAYRYSGVSHPPKPFTESLEALLNLIKEMTKHEFNSVLVNLYRNGYDHIGWHQDNETELGENPIIASLSFGATRRFDLQRLDQKASFSIRLQSGQLLVMAGALQKHWLHRIFKEPTIQEPRLNLTFRYIK